jgi:hypothetical protein
MNLQALEDSSRIAISEDVCLLCFIISFDKNGVGM